MGESVFSRNEGGGREVAAMSKIKPKQNVKYLCSA